MNRTKDTQINDEVITADKTAMTRCPTCGSANITKAGGQFKTVGFQAFPNQSCGDCGTVWRPGCSKSVAIVCVISGCAGGLVSLLMFHGFAGSWAICMLGVMPILYGFSVLLGIGGRMKVLSKGVAFVKPVQQVTTGKYDRSAGEVVRRCQSCAKVIEPDVGICPHCRWPQRR